MSAEIVKQMRAEEAVLVRKLTAVRTFLAAYGEEPLDADPAERPRASRRKAGGREKVDITSFTVQTRQSVLIALEALVHSNSLMRTSDLVEYISNRGHEVSGSNKVNALGALLARSVDVEGHGKSGWTVADRDAALGILRQYLYKEKEPSSETAVGSYAAGASVTALEPAFGNPQRDLVG